MRMITAMNDDNTAIHCIIGCNDNNYNDYDYSFYYGSYCASLCSHMITMIA